MKLSELTAISPIDEDIELKQRVKRFFSEAALIRYRVLVEVEYFISLCHIPLPQLNGFDNTLYMSYVNFIKTSLWKMRPLKKSKK